MELGLLHLMNLVENRYMQDFQDEDYAFEEDDIFLNDDRINAFLKSLL